MLSDIQLSHNNRKRGEKMKFNRDGIKNTETKRLEQISYIMEHWDELPEGLQGRFKGTIDTAQEFLKEKISQSAH